MTYRWTGSRAPTAGELELIEGAIRTCKVRPGSTFRPNPGGGVQAVPPRAVRAARAPKRRANPRKTPFHVYARDGFESAHSSLAAAKRAAARGARKRGQRYEVVKVSAHGVTGAGHGDVVAVAEPPRRRNPRLPPAGSRQRSVFAIATVAYTDRQGWASYADPKEKAALRALEKKGLVRVRKTGEKVAGFEELEGQLTEAGVKLAKQHYASDFEAADYSRRANPSKKRPAKRRPTKKKRPAKKRPTKKRKTAKRKR